VAIRKRMNHVAAGLLGAFYSRCNELNGFWALGMLYKEVQSEPYRVTLDLLAETATPRGPNAILIATRYGEFLRRALLKKDLRAEDLTEATVTVQFKAKIPPMRFQPHWVGDAFTCTVTLQRSDTKATYTVNGKCMPNDPRLFSQGGSRSAHSYEQHRT